MMGYSLFVRNLTVAGAAFLGSVRQKRIMRIMAFHARFAGIMKHRNDLRKSRGAGGIVTVAKRAMSAPPRSLRCKFIGGLDMLCGGSVTYFAGYITVMRFFFKLGDIIMAINTRPVTGILDLLRYYLTHRIGPVMTVFSE